MRSPGLKFILCLLSLVTFGTLARAQSGDFTDFEKLPKLGVVRAIHSLDESHLAVWYWSNKEDFMQTDGSILVIYEVKNGAFSEVFKLKSTVDGGWNRIEPLCDTRLTAIKIESGTITNYDSAIIIALVDGKFQKVFEGSTSEFRDLNEDGIPELFEAEWPDGDGYPTTATVHFWNGKTYKRLMKVSYRKRFGPVVQAAVAKKSIPRQ